VILETGWADWRYDLAKEVIVAVLSFVGGVALERYNRFRSRSTRAAAYFQSISAALEEMANSFEQSKIPYLASNALNTLLEEFGTMTGRLMKDPMITTAKRLSDLTMRAENLDWQIGRRKSRTSVPTDVDAWIVEARRLAGELRARASLFLAR
jgi:hypothetical protein